MLGNLAGLRRSCFALLMFAPAASYGKTQAAFEYAFLLVSRTSLT